MKKLLWIVFAVLAIGIGLYPLSYLAMDESMGLLSTKSPYVLNNFIWNIAFYMHIVFGGLALLIGWIQFNKTFRNKNLNRHRTIGKVYMVSVLISGITSLYIGLYATGGWVASLGFILLGIIWLFTTTKAYIHIREKNISMHENCMIYSYAACFAAVTLRIWLPMLSAAFGDFIVAYTIVAWLCWVPNILVAFLIVQKRSKSPTQTLYQ